MPTETTIDYSRARVRFVVSCPTWDIGKGQQFPKRKWLKEERAWEFPVTSHTVTLLHDAWPDAIWTKEAEETGRKTLEARTSLIPADRTPFPATYRFKLQPMKHQKLGLDYTYSLDRAALFCEMRVGKTLIAIVDAVQKYQEGKIQRILIFAPNGTLLNWLDELKKNVSIKYLAHALRLSHHREAMEWLENLNGNNPVFAVISYESLSSNSTRAFDWAKLFIDHRPTAMICDESHWLKNGKAQRTQRVAEIGKQTIRRRLLTGTEITKDLEDLYAQYGILGDILPMDSFFAYRNRYCVMGGFQGREIAGYKNTKELFDCIRPFTFQVKRSDVRKDLPERMPQKIMVEMSPDQEKEYKKAKKATTTPDGRPMNTLTKALRLHQIAGGFTNLGLDADRQPIEEWRWDSKINSMIEFLRPIEGSVVIWARYKIEIDRIEQAIKRIYGIDDHYLYTGDTKIDERDRIKKAFLRGERRFLIGNTNTGGVGIDLSVADTVIFYSSSHNYAEQAQAKDRVQNLERKTAVLYGYLVCADTIDELIMEALEAKQSLADYLKTEIGKRKEYL